MDQLADPLSALFAHAKAYRIPMSAICRRANVDPTTPSRWKRGANGASLDKLKLLQEALRDLIVEQQASVAEQAAA